VIVDDLHRLTDVAAGYCGAYPRPRLLEAPLTTLTSYAQEVGKKLVVGAAHGVPEPVLQRALQFGIPDYTPDDYAFLRRAHLGSPLPSALASSGLPRSPPPLSAPLFRTVRPALRRRASLSTQEFIDYLREHGLTSNVDLGEVQRVELRDLKGIDEIIASLEAN